jgi:hypothetical protein
MTYRNKSYEVGDLVEDAWSSNMTGIIVEVLHTTLGQKAKVLWSQIGTRIEWLSDIRRIK